jgi:transcriptional regulator with XRE-family HTH domain
MRLKFKEQSEFGARLKKLRQARGFTQKELGERIGATQKMITHYENRVKFPPVVIIPKIAKALKISADELLGLKPCKDEDLAETRKLMRRFKTVGTLSLRDQRTIFSMINSLKTKHALKSQNQNGAN